MSLPRLLPALLSASLLLGACSHAPLPAADTTVTTPAFTPAQIKTNAALHTLARQLAATLTDPGVRSLIAQQTALKATGDTEALYATLAPLSTGRGTFAQALASGMGTQSLSAAVADIPRLHVAVRGGAWDAAHTVPWVAVAPEGGDEWAAVTAYDAEGHAHQLDSRTVPAFPLVVVGVNERTDDHGALLSPTLLSTAPTLETSNVTAQGCYEVRLVQFFLYNAMEPFIKGRAEIYAAVKGPGMLWHGYFPEMDAAADYFFTKRFGCTDGDVRFYWYEKDGGSENHAITFGTYSFGLSNDASDDFLGATLLRKESFAGTTRSAVDLGNFKQWTD